MSGAPIFAYHDVVADDGALAAVAPAHRPYVLTRARFVSHLDALAGAALAEGTTARAATVTDLIDGSVRGRFVLSFDDGHVSNYTEVLPLLAERGWPATFFVVAGWIGGRDALTWPQLRALADTGMEIGSHSLTHVPMQGRPDADIRHEFGESKRILEDGLGRAVTAASLPRGSAEPRAAKIVADLGYRAFCTSEPGLVGVATDPFDAPRIAIKWRTPAGFVSRMLAGDRLALAGLRSSYAVKQLAQRVVGVERWRRVRGALVAGTSGASPADVVEGREAR